MVFEQDITIPMGTDPAAFWPNLFLYFFEPKHTKQPISNGFLKHINMLNSSCSYAHARFIDEFCAINDDNEFLTLFKNIYTKKLKLKIKHQGNHASFFNLDIKTEGSVFVYKLFYKRDKFPFFIVKNGPFVKQFILYNFLWGYIFRTSSH